MSTLSCSQQILFFSRKNTKHGNAFASYSNGTDFGLQNNRLLQVNSKKFHFAFRAERNYELPSSKHSVSNSEIFPPSILFFDSNVKPRRGKSFTCKSFISPPTQKPPAGISNDDEKDETFLDSSSDSNPSLQTQSSSSSLHSKPEKLITWKSILGIVFKEKRLLVFSFLALIIGTASSLSLPQFSGQFFENLIGKGKYPLPRLMSFLFCCYLGEVLSTVVYVSSVIRIWERVVASVKRNVFRSLISQNIAFFDRHNVGELTSLFAVELATLEKFVSDNVTRDRGLRSISEVLVTMIILFNTSIELAPAFIFLMIGISVGVGIYKRTTFPAFLSHALAQKRIIECATESFSAIRTVRSFGGERRQVSFFDSEADRCKNSGERIGMLRSLNEAWTRVSIYTSLFCVYILGDAKVKAGSISPGTVLAFIGYTFTLTFATQGLVNTFADLRNVMYSIDRINTNFADAMSSTAFGKFVDQKEKVNSKAKIKVKEENADRLDSVVENSRHESSMEVFRSNSSAQVVEEPPSTSKPHACPLQIFANGDDSCFRGDIIMENVYFSYPQRPDTNVLKGLNLNLQSSKITALVGGSGAGKSTIVQLLSRFYEPTRGRISISGEEINRFSPQDWSRAVSLVNQDPVLFSSSIRDNISYGLPNEDVSENDIIEAAKSANAHEFIVNLPQGYDTHVGERGGLLSGGQRQRIAIARALLKNSPILILDEATSALDSVSERLVQTALERLMKGRTTLVIAHRLSTVQSADQIAVISEGQIMEMGSHAVLLDMGGRYSQLVHSQRLTFE